MHIQSTKLLDFIHTPSLRRMNYKFHMNSSRTCGSLGEADGSWCRAECLFKVQEMDYLGHKVNSDGIHPADKIKSIQDVPQPQYVTELELLLGLLSYYGNLLSNMSKS